MSNIIFINDSVTNGFNSIFIYIITVISILCGILVIISKNPIVSVLFLIGLFISISAYLMILGINFIGLSYLLVYVGAVSILFLFILMLINIRISEIISTTSNSIPLSIIIGILFFSTLYKALPTSKTVIYNNNILGSYDMKILYTSIKDEINKYYLGIYNLFKDITGNYLNLSNKSIVNSNFNLSNNTEISYDSIYLTYTHNWDNMLAEVSHINTIGNILYTSFSLWLLLTSLILLLAMVGAIVITLKV